MVPIKFESPIKIGEINIIRVVVISKWIWASLNPGAIKWTMYGIKITIKILAITIKTMKALKILFMKARALSFALSSLLILSTKKGISTVTEASEAIDIYKKSGILNAA